jgi:hypothetical protein
MILYMNLPPKSETEIFDELSKERLYNMIHEIKSTIHGHKHLLDTLAEVNKELARKGKAILRKEKSSLEKDLIFRIEQKQKQLDLILKLSKNGPST